MGPGRGLQRSSLFLMPPDTVPTRSKARVHGCGAGVGGGGGRPVFLSDVRAYFPTQLRDEEGAMSPGSYWLKVRQLPVPANEQAC